MSTQFTNVRDSLQWAKEITTEQTTGMIAHKCMEDETHSVF